MTLSLTPLRLFERKRAQPTILGFASKFGRVFA